MKSQRILSPVVGLILFASYGHVMIDFSLRASAQTSTSSAVKVARPAGMSKINVPLSTGWQFREAGKDKWYPATVPGCVHTDLLTNRLIDDPFYRDNEKKLQWIGKTDWEYQFSLNLTPEILAQ